MAQLTAAARRARLDRLHRHRPRITRDGWWLALFMAALLLFGGLIYAWR
ncbi:hypothetical protein [Hymenobacter coalescens]